jgi:hypothetical protein
MVSLVAAGVARVDSRDCLGNDISIQPNLFSPLCSGTRKIMGQYYIDRSSFEIQMMTQSDLPGERFQELPSENSDLRLTSGSIEEEELNWNCNDQQQQL